MLSALAIWLLFYGWLGLVGLAPARRLFPHHRDLGCALGRVLILLSLTFFAFLGRVTGASDGGRGFLAGAALTLTVVAAIIAYRDRAALRQAVGRHRADLALTEALGLLAFLVFLIPLLYTDTSRFGERAMDLAFLGRLAAGGPLPPENPFLSGAPLNYYYYGHLMWASVSRLLGLRAVDAYLLAAASVAGLTVAAAASLLSRLTANRKGVLVGIVLTFFAMNLGYVRSWTGTGRADPFLAANWMVGNAITEFPLYTFVVAELHAHAMMMPAFVAALALAVALTDALQKNVSGGRVAATVVALALALGSLGPTSSWSMLSATAAVLALLGAGTFADRSAHRWRQSAGLAVLIVGLSFALYLPFYLGLHILPAWPRLVGRLSSQPTGFALHWGMFLWTIAAWSLCRETPHPAPGGAGATPRHHPFVLLFGAGSLAVVTAHLAVLQNPARTLPLALALGATVLSGHHAARAGGGEHGRYSWILAAVGCLLIAFCELIYLDDRHGGGLQRATTVFKFSLHAWLLLGLGTADAGAALLTASLRGNLRARLAALCCMPVVLHLLLGSGYAARGMLVKTGGFRGGPHLSAVHFQEKRDPGYAATMRRIAQEADRRKRRPVVAEAVDRNRNTNWLGVATGASAYVAWPGQLVQWGYSPRELRARIDNLRRLYTATDARDACALMAAEGIDLVFFGAAEARRFGPLTRIHFDRPPMHRLFTAGGSALYTCGALWPATESR